METNKLLHKMILARQSAATSPGPVSNANHGNRILAVTGFFMAVASLVVLARLYVRSVMLKTVWVDDWIMILSMVRLAQPLNVSIASELTILSGLLCNDIRLFC